MFKKAIDEMIKGNNNIVDECVKTLLKVAGIQLQETITGCDIIYIQNELKKKRLIIERNSNDPNKDKILLVRLGDMHEEIIAGYEILTEYDMEKLTAKIYAKPLEV